jgi:hypothetical protein
VQTADENHSNPNVTKRAAPHTSKLMLATDEPYDSNIDRIMREIGRPCINMAVVEAAHAAIRFAFAASDDTSPARLLPNPVCMDPEHFNIVMKGSFAVSTKADGMRCVLCIIRVHREQYCIMMNRSGEVFMASLCAKESLWEGSGTILDGEIVIGSVNKSRRMILCLFDSPMVAGHSICALPLKERRELLAGAIAGARLQAQGGADIHLVRKPFLSASPANIRYIISAAKMCHAYMDVAKTTLIPCDGIILASTADPLRFGDDYKMFKVKDSYSIDLLLLIKPTGLCADPLLENRITYAGSKATSAAAAAATAAAATTSAAATAAQWIRWSVRMQFERWGLTDFFHTVQFAGVEMRVVMEVTSQMRGIFALFEKSAQNAFSKIRCGDSRRLVHSIGKFQCIVECAMSIDFSERLITLRIVKKRTDKQSPNDFLHIMRIIASMQSNMNMDALDALAKKLM